MLASAAHVDPGRVEVAIAAGRTGSVILSVVIRALTDDAATAAGEAIAPRIADPIAATTLLGELHRLRITVEAVTTVMPSPLPATVPGGVIPVANGSSDLTDAVERLPVDSSSTVIAVAIAAIVVTWLILALLSFFHAHGKRRSGGITLRRVRRAAKPPKSNAVLTSASSSSTQDVVSSTVNNVSSTAREHFDVEVASSDMPEDTSGAMASTHQASVKFEADFPSNTPLGVTIATATHGGVQLLAKEPSSPAASVPNGAMVVAVDGVNCLGKSKEEVSVMIIDARSTAPNGSVRLTFEGESTVGLEESSEMTEHPTPITSVLDAFFSSTPTAAALEEMTEQPTPIVPVLNTFFSSKSTADREGTSGMTTDHMTDQPRPILSILNTFFSSMSISASTAASNSRSTTASSVRKTRALQAMTEWAWRSEGLSWFNKLGSGSFATVFRVQYGDEILAAKKVTVTEDDDESHSKTEALETEFRALKKLNHPHVVKLFGVARDESMICLLMELADKGSLRQMLDAHPEAILGNTEVQISLAFDIARGLAFCHVQTPEPLLHKDIKTANVLLFSHDARGHPRLTAKLSDFGIAVGVSGATTRGLTAQTQANATGGTRAYRAPETFKGKYTMASEVYSYAIVLWEILSGQRPWHRDEHGKPYMDEHFFYLVVRCKKRPETPKGIGRTRVLATLMKRCWSHRPRSRPPFASIVAELSRKLPHRVEPSVMSREEAEAQLASERQLQGSELASFIAQSSSPDTKELYDIFITFRFGEAHAEAVALKAGLEVYGLKVFLSNAAPGTDLQDLISHALATCKLAVILATETYGRKTNALFCTSSEMNYILDGNRKPFYLVRMIPSSQDWAEPATTMAFPSSVMYKLWMPGDPMPNDLIDDIIARLTLTVPGVEFVANHAASSTGTIDASTVSVDPRAGSEDPIADAGSSSTNVLSVGLGVPDLTWSPLVARSSSQPVVVGHTPFPIIARSSSQPVASQLTEQQARAKSLAEAAVEKAALRKAAAGSTPPRADPVKAVENERETQATQSAAQPSQPQLPQPPLSSKALGKQPMRQAVEAQPTQSAAQPSQPSQLSQQEDDGLAVDLLQSRIDPVSCDNVSKNIARVHSQDSYHSPGRTETPQPSRSSKALGKQPMRQAAEAVPYSMTSDSITSI